ncbi:MAG: type II toxin-antitoxin system RelE/ParE family toxin [Chloroflexi bacterium]|nr:type II toxin-antitoxin system RelE/ParE family toxin [Chloroflexota bacterium]MCI0785426.1 type II toxin-antitoxin system RelE/ParE family toxin [Chloroflexota bacterium]MCI0865764.1 type II toxin-antitoxin system RelE/ParE family toxin [Chloroflexota bacterium]MCI0878386.1 type II toxin-antitoxin system RelE/ParE family toxin [Chloroflexota bacterium]MCI0894157.1 type II toxin-antitoxin system RelE/ParE family toxin [Chloroflexota bacterium]
MAEYRVEIIRPAVREIQSLEQTQARRILASVEALASQPRPRQSRKLTGTENSYRLRVGAYRVLYQVDDNQRTVTVFAIGHRRQIYR